jgi:hypothetical protein
MDEKIMNVLLNYLVEVLDVELQLLKVIPMEQLGIIVEEIIDIVNETEGRKDT